MQGITKQPKEAPSKDTLEIKANASSKCPVDDSSIVELAHALHNIDLENPQAELNATTISDNNGGRIVL